MSSNKKLSFQPSKQATRTTTTPHSTSKSQINGYVFQFSYWLAAIRDVHGCTKELRYWLNTQGEKKRRPK